MSAAVVLEDSPEEYLNHAGPLLYKDEATNSLMLGLCSNLIGLKSSQQDLPVMVRVVENGKTVTAALQIPSTSLVLAPKNLIVTHADSKHVELMARHLVTTGTEIVGVIGPSKVSETFAATWSKLSQKNSKLRKEQRIYKIEKVIMPDTEGQLRLAQPHEVDLITQWLVEFGEESLLPEERKSFFERRPAAVNAIKNNLAYMWTVGDKPVSVAHVGRPTQNGISVSAVYTPKVFRKKGYASGLVAHLSQKMLDSGKKFCVLYTELWNTTSNKIYKEIGYQEVVDSNHYFFD
jgi:predicted GNAT family acetyltransferase